MTDQTPEGNLPTYLVTAGGWCAPSEALYRLDGEGGQHDAESVFTILSAVVRRGGITFPEPGSPEWRQAQRDAEVVAALRAQIIRAISNVTMAQDAAIAAAWMTSNDDQAVHVYPAPYDWSEPGHYRGIYRFIGISVEPGLRAVHHHDATRSTPYGWDDDDEW